MDFKIDHFALIISIIGGFIGLGAFIYKIASWINKINTELKESHECITRLENRIQTLLQHKHFQEDAAGII